MLTSYTSSEEENIPYLRKSAQIIRNIDEGPKLFDHTRSKSASGYRPPFADLDPPLPNVPFKHRLYHTWSLILFGSFLPMFFSITTQHSSVKVKPEKQPFRSNSAACILPSRTVYAIIKCEQTTAFELLKLFQ